MSSSSSNDGSSTITVTFNVGYPLNIAAVDVQNRVSQAASSLPAIVNQAGVTIKKQNPNFVLIVNLDLAGQFGRSGRRSQQLRLSADRRSAEAAAGRRRRADLRRAALFDAHLARSGQARQSRHHRRRRPERDRRAERSGRRRQDRPVAGARRDRIRVAGQRHRAGSAIPQEFGNIVVRADPASGAVVRLRDVARVELGALQYSSSAFFGKDPTVVLARLPDAGLERARPAEAASRRRWRSCRSASRQGIAYAMHYDTTRFVSAAMHDVVITLVEALLLVVARRLHLPAELAHDDHPHHRHSGFADRDAGGDAGPRLLAQHAEPARHGAGDRPCRRRRDRRRRECRAPARGRAAAA